MRTVIDLGHSLDMLVTTEGNETAEQLERLKQLRCDIGQGFLFCRPVSAADFAALRAQPSALD